MTRYPARPAEILLVEDGLDDIEIARRALSRTRVAHRLHVVRDGQEALDFLLRRGPHKAARAPRPDLILLDLNLPRLNGIETLGRIRAHAALSVIPVVMLTASGRDEDVLRSYRGGSNTYIQKPLAFADFVRALEVVLEYWTVVAKLPPRAA